ncbi:MAG TPA: hypothetical protein VIL32_11800 [Steroidobacteraceae bacterium]
MGIVISWPQVESLTLYDENLYRAFQAMEAAQAADLLRWAG